MTRIVLDPVTRVSGLLNISVEVNNNKVVEARSSGSQFRGFEQMFQGRPPLDIISLSPRICGICSTSHALASTLALEDAFKVTPDFNGKVIRDIAHGFELIQNYIRHTYFLAFPDYVSIIKVNPLYKTITDKNADYRLSKEATDAINNSYIEAIKFSREAHRGIAVLAGKAPHCHGIFVGGATTNINIQQIESIKYINSILKDFIENKMLPDVYTIAKAYDDYYSIGKGYGNLMSYGLFNDYNKPIQYVSPSAIINGVKEDINTDNLTENITNTWVESSSDTITPGGSEPPTPNPYKENAYSWVNAPRYKGYSMEGGSLARMILSGNYTYAVSVMDRIVAKALEAKKVCEIIYELIGLLKLGNAIKKDWSIPNEATGKGLVDAERGALGHWVSIKDKKISNYTLIPPSSWNLSPTDNNKVRGPVEQALIGTQINNVNDPIEIGRIVRSFDPCLNCAAHVTSDKHEPVTIEILS